MHPTYSPPFVADRITGMLMGVGVVCFGAASALLLSGAFEMRRMMANDLGPAGPPGFGSAPPTPSLAAPVALVVLFLVVYLACAIGVYRGRAWAFWLTIGFMVFSLAAGKMGQLALLIAIGLVLYSALRLGGVIGPKPT
jgi:hypothetical protein